MRPTPAAVLVTLVLIGCAEEPPSADTRSPKVAAESSRALDADSTRLVYVPVYSHVSYRAGRRIDLATTLSVRSTDPQRPIVLTWVGYYDSDGALVRDYVTAPTVLGPMASIDFLVEESDRTGGVGANFLVEWTAEEPVSEPVIEAVMLGTGGAQGVSFVSPGRPVERRDPARSPNPPARP